MTDAQQRWLVKSLDRLSDRIRTQPGFLEDEELKAAYVVVHSAVAALASGKLPDLAVSCAEWCGRKADESGGLMN